MIKDTVKFIAGKLRCMLNGLNSGKKVYIGKNCRFVGKGKFDIEDNVSIRPDGFFASGKGALNHIGKGSDIGCRARISAVNRIYIGNNVLMGPNVYIADQDHRYDIIGVPIMNQGITIKNNSKLCKEGIEIQDGAWISINCVIVGNVNIGKGSVIGANSVVTTDIPDYCVAVGSPCRVIKKYNFKTKAWEKVNENSNAC